MKFKKGQAGSNIVSSMVLLMLIGFLGIVSVTVYSSIDTSMSSTASSTLATHTIGNFTENFYDGMDLTSNIPIVLAASLLLMVIVGFALYVRG